MNVAELFATLGLKTDVRGFAAADKMLTGLKVALVGLVAHRGWSFLTGSLDQVTEAASRAVDESQRLGVSAEALQELGYAADLSGSSFEGMTGALTKFSRNLEKAKQGGGEAGDAFRKLGINVKRDLANETLDQNLELIAERISQMPDGAEKAAVAMQLFGRSGTKLIPLLNEGQEGIVKLRNEARELGVVIDEETAKSLEEFGDDQDRLKASMTGLKNEVVKALLPTLSKMVKSTIAWVKANRQLLAQRLEKALKGLIAILKLTIDVVGALAKALMFLADNMGLVTLATLTLAAAYLVLRARAIAAAVASAAMWAASMIGPALVALAIAALILVIEDLYRWVNGGESVFKEMYEAAKVWIGDKLEALIGGAKILIQSFLGMETDPQKAIRKMDEDAKRKALARNVAGAGGAEEDAALNQNLRSTAFGALFGQGDYGQVSLANRLATVRALSRDYVPEDSTAAMVREFVRPSNNMQATITQTFGPGTDEAAAKKGTMLGLDEWWEGTLRQAQSGTGGGSQP